MSNKLITPGFGFDHVELDSETKQFVGGLEEGRYSARDAAQFRYEKNCKTFDSVDRGNGPLLAEQLEQQLRMIETDYEDLDALRLFPVDNSIAEGATEFSVYRTERRGGAAFFRGNSSDIPTPSFDQEKETFAIKHVVTGMTWNHMELRSAQFAGVALKSQYEQACERAVMEFMDENLWTTNEPGLLGILDNPYVGSLTLGVQLGDTASAVSFVDALVKATTLNPQISKGKNRHVRLIAPNRTVDYMARRDKVGTYPKSMLADLQEKARYIDSIETTHQLEGRGPGGTDVIVLDAGRGNVVNGFSAAIPRGLTYLPMQRTNFQYIQVGYADFGGANCYKPLNQLYVYIQNEAGGGVAGA